MPEQDQQQDQPGRPATGSEFFAALARSAEQFEREEYLRTGWRPDRDDWRPPAGDDADAYRHSPADEDVAES